MKAITMSFEVFAVKKRVTQTWLFLFSVWVCLQY